MKKPVPPAAAAAGRAARGHILLPVGLGLMAAALLTVTTAEYLALHCFVGALLGFVSGIVTGRAAAGHDPQSAVRQGATGGAIAGFAYSLPFMAGAAYRWLHLDAAEVARRVAALSAEQLALARQANVDMTAYAYYSNQEVSYFFGYLLFGASLGWLFGAVGGARARDQRRENNSAAAKPM